MSSIDLLHLIFVYERFSTERQKHFPALKNCNDVIEVLLNKTSNPDPFFVKEFVSFIILILESCESEGLVELFRLI